MLHTTKTFQINSSIYFDCEFYNLSYIPTDPVSPAWEIRDALGGLVDSSATSGGPYKSADGIWYFIYVPTTVGDYVLTWTGTIDSKSVSVKKRFKVININLR